MVDIKVIFRPNVFGPWNKNKIPLSRRTWRKYTTC